MRKVSLILAVVLFAVPAWAASTVTVTATQVGTTKDVDITYVAGPNLPRAFALGIEVNNAATIDNVTGFHVGESNSVSKGYGIFPGTIVIVDGVVQDYNTPVAPSTAPDNPGQLGSSKIVIEMGSLYDANKPLDAPAPSGKLCTITVSKECCVHLTEESAYRGGIVMESPDEQPVVTLVDGCVVVQDCLIGGNAGTKEKSDWDTWGKPNCWCYCRQCRGDADGTKTGLYWVAIPDLTLLYSAYGKTDAQLKGVPNGICCDFDHKKTGLYRVAIPDLTIAYAYYGKTQTNVPRCDLADPPRGYDVPYTGPYNFWCSPAGCPYTCP